MKAGGMFLRQDHAARDHSWPFARCNQTVLASNGLHGPGLNCKMLIPELKERAERISKVVLTEESRFAHTLDGWALKGLGARSFRHRPG